MDSKFSEQLLLDNTLAMLEDSSPDGHLTTELRHPQRLLLENSPTMLVTEQLQLNTIPQLYRSQYNTQYNTYKKILTTSQHFQLYTALYSEILLSIELIVI